jgi:FkbM family methyltransferase
VHVFEPVPAFAASIARRFAKNPRVTVHAFGLGADERTIRLSLAADGTSALRAAGRETVEGRIERAAEWFSREGVQRVDLMKVNVEGAEYELLEHLLDAGLMPRIRNLQVQFHDFVPDARARMEAIRRRLAATHAPDWQFEFVWESWRLRE